MGIREVKVNGIYWKIPSWLFLESEKSVLVIRDVPFWAQREVYGQPYHVYLRELGRAIGRPRKYRRILEALDFDGLYTSAAIVRFAEEQGFVTQFLQEEPDGPDVRLLKRRMRISFNRTRDLYGFPIEGDGLVTIKGQAPKPAWFGWRWLGTCQWKGKV